jgi:two-component system, chemotaxis family, CheB/CheR fusion protein
VRGGAERLEGLLMQLPVGVVLVDRRYDVQSINTAARRLLGIHASAIGDDFVHLAQSVPSATLREAIEAALRPPTAGQPPPVAEHVLPVEPPVGEVRFLQISAHAYRHEENGEGLAVVLIADVTTLEADRRRLADERSAVDGEVKRQEQQLARLTEANTQLLDANQELAAVNATLRSANEELLLSHEEAQAATEEVETLNEELQATNEEQETLNEELQATVEELNTTNDDLQARSAELQELTIAMEIEREQLRAVLSSMSDAVLVLDNAGAAMLTNQAYEQAFGRPARGARPLEALGALAERAAGGEPFTAHFKHSGGDGREREYEARGRAIRGADGRQGSVITFRETG